MKKIMTFITTMLLLMGVNVNAQQTWDFSKTPETDVAALAAATTEWDYTETIRRLFHR